MAQVVGYWEDNVVYREGPFVVVELGDGDDYRVEVENKTSEKKTPCLPDSSIYFFLNFSQRTRGRLEEVTRTVDFLNQNVKNGCITCREGTWLRDRTTP